MPHCRARDEAVANVYATYLGAALQEPDVAALMTFGLSDRYTWLQEDYPRDDGAARRPLPFGDDMSPKPALTALGSSLTDAAERQAALASESGVRPDRDVCPSCSLPRVVPVDVR
jgi:hypothetical protein